MGSRDGRAIYGGPGRTVTLNSEPAEGARLILARWPVQGNLHTAALRRDGDARGAYRFDSLPPGEYRIVAVAPEEAGRLEEPFAIDRLLANGDSIRLGRGGHASLNLRLADLF